MVCSHTEENPSDCIHCMNVGASQTSWTHQGGPTLQTKWPSPALWTRYSFLSHSSSGVLLFLNTRYVNRSFWKEAATSTDLSASLIVGLEFRWLERDWDVARPEPNYRGGIFSLLNSHWLPSFSTWPNYLNCLEYTNTDWVSNRTKCLQCHQTIAGTPLLCLTHLPLKTKCPCILEASWFITSLALLL